MIPKLRKENFEAAMIVYEEIKKNPEGIIQRDVKRIIDKNKKCLNNSHYMFDGNAHYKNYKNIIQYLLLSKMVKKIHYKRNIRYFNYE